MVGRESMRPFIAACFALALLPGRALAQILITEVVPGVVTTATSGDTVELFNAGAVPVDITGYVLSDLDAAPIELDVMDEGTFLPLALGAPALAPGSFCVVVFADIAGTASVTVTNYGLLIVAPLTAGSYMDSTFDQLVLLDSSGTPLDSVVWGITSAAPSNLADTLEDLAALTAPTTDYNLPSLGNAAWNGTDDIAVLADYEAAMVDFTGFEAATTYGGGALRRLSVGATFAQGAPDGTTQWEAVARHRVRLGNPSDQVTVPSGISPILAAGDITQWLGSIDASNFPDRRIARDADQSPADFIPADALRRSNFTGVLALAWDGLWEETYAAADPLGYEVVEFLHLPGGQTFHILREQAIPGELEFTGQGTFVFYDGVGVRPLLSLQVPHPRFDSNTLQEVAMALPQVLPRAVLVAGAHRNNHPDDTICDGTQSNGANYRRSDVAHATENLFHTAHLFLHSEWNNGLTIQFHGFCCPGSAPYASLNADAVLSNGVNAPPGASDFTQLWRTRIDAENFFADDGSPGGDLTTAVVYGDDATVLGATNNIQGRVTNGVDVDLACTTPAGAATGRFIHIEQDPDVREEPQHIISALLLALEDWAAIPVTLTHATAE